MSVTITRCPPMPAAGVEEFDHYQFGLQARTAANTKEKNVLDYASMERSHKIYRANRDRLAPLWTRDDKKIAAVVREAVLRTIPNPTGGYRFRPRTFAGLRRADRKIVKWLKARKEPELRKRAEIAERNGGIAAFLTTVIFRSYRNGQQCTEIAEQTGASPVVCRHALTRMNFLARELFPDESLHQSPLFNKQRSPVKPARLCTVRGCRERAASKVFCQRHREMHNASTRESNRRSREKERAEKGGEDVLRPTARGSLLT